MKCPYFPEVWSVCWGKSRPETEYRVGRAFQWILNPPWVQFFIALLLTQPKGRAKYFFLNHDIRMITSLILKPSNNYGLSQCLWPNVLISSQDIQQFYLSPNIQLFDLVGAIKGSNSLALFQIGAEPFLWALTMNPVH